jgi:hypothetical protein
MKIQQIALKGDPFNAYLVNYKAAEKQMLKSIAALPGGKTGTAGMGAITGFYAFAKTGSTSPFAQSIIALKSANLSPAGKARAVLAIFAGAKSLGDSRDAAGGVSLGIDLQSGPTGDVDKSFDSPGSFVEQVISMAAFDVAGETKRVLAKPGAKGTVTGVPGEMEASSPAAPATTGQAPTKDWNTYLSKTPKGGPEVKVAWEAYSRSTGASPDFNSFARWWSGKKKDPSFKGDPAATVSYLKSMTRAGGALKVSDVSVPRTPGT